MFPPFKTLVRWSSLLSAGFLLACSKPPETPPLQRPVQVFSVGQAGVGADRIFTGEIRSRTETALSFRTTGKIQERLVQLGDRVQAGQLLARLDVQDNQLGLDAASAQAVLAENEYRRYQDLRSRNFVSQAALDAREAAARSARAQAALAGHQRDYTELRATQSGIVAGVLAETGQVVAAGQAVFRLAREDQAEAAIQVSEQQVLQLKKGMAATLVPWADSTKTWSGRIREIAAVAELPARTYAVRVQLDTPVPEDLRLGQSVAVHLGKPETSASGWQVPSTAIFQQGNTPAVWVLVPVEGGDPQVRLATVKLQVVQVAAWRETDVLLAAGVKPGDQLVRAGVHKLTEGETVRVAQP